MKVITYILMNVALGHSDDVIRELIKIDQIRSASVVSGIYDVIVRVETNDLSELHSVTTHQIHKIENITKTTSLVVGTELTIPE
ncbi:MAG: Lrp/AsnC ligand binding domain-containing protein [Candidatus Hodarchaeales archaeon]